MTEYRHATETNDSTEEEDYTPGKFKQSEIDEHIGLLDENGNLIKRSCNITADISIFVNQAIKDGTINPDIINPATGEVDLTKVYDIAKSYGDSIIKGNFSVADDEKLAKIIAPTSNYSLVNGGTVTSDNIINHLDSGQPVKVTLSDGHRETIYDYDTDANGNVTRFKIDDVGYQGDKYVDPKTMQPYKVTNEGTKYEKKKYSQSHGDGSARTVNNIQVLQ